MITETTAATKRDLIVEELRRLILSGELPRGARLPQDELATRFSSSITPVREALRALEAEGIVVSEPHRGTRVAGVDLDRIKAIYIVRRLVEPYAMLRATSRLSARDLRQADDLLHAVEVAAAAGDATGARQANRAFHFHFYDRCGLPTLSDQIASLWAAFPWDLVLQTPQRSGQSDDEHRLILEAARRGEANEAADATAMHIARGFSAIVRHLTGDDAPDPFDVDTD
jgi:DNA-binding GntR family transcriptional regulator